MQLLQDRNQTDEENLSYVRWEVSGHFRKKRRRNI